MLRFPGNLRLIQKELEITIKASTNEIFPVKIQPGKAKVIELMEQIERKLGVPIKDQKLCHGEARLSDAPQRSLPEEFICSVEPTLIIIVPEYILVTVEDLISGDTKIVKIDKEKTLKDLMEEMTSCNLQENEEAMFYVNGKELCPSKDTGTLTSLGVSSGSKMELKVTITFIDVYVACISAVILSPGFWPYRCGLQETFKDLLNKIEAKGSTGKLEGATFLTQERVFDAEKDTGSLQSMSSIIKTKLSKC